jgi:hypothetical protein
LASATGISLRTCTPTMRLPGERPPSIYLLRQ